jgi:hypothetical protein
MLHLKFQMLCLATHLMLLLHLVLPLLLLHVCRLLLRASAP